MIFHLKLCSIAALCSVLVGCSDEDAITTALAQQLQIPKGELSTQHWRFSDRLTGGRRWGCVDYTAPGTTDSATAMVYRASSEASWTVLDTNSTAVACDAVENAVVMLGVSGLSSEIVDSLEAVLTMFSTPEQALVAKAEISARVPTTAGN